MWSDPWSKHLEHDFGRKYLLNGQDKQIWMVHFWKAQIILNKYPYPYMKIEYFIFERFFHPFEKNHHLSVCLDYNRVYILM